MAKNKRLDFMDEAIQSAELKEKQTTQADTQGIKKIKTIQLYVEWEERIKSSYIGSVSNFITQAIYEKMERDKII